MIKIGDFARLGQVSVVTLRHYDEMDLLKPVRVEPLTGYRFYAADQLPRLNRILALKDLGFSLEQIKLMLADGLTAEQLRSLLTMQRREVERRVSEEQERLGASIGTGASIDASTVTLDALKLNLAPSLALMADVTRNPAFAPGEVERVKHQQLAGLAAPTPLVVDQPVGPEHAVEDVGHVESSLSIAETRALDALCVYQREERAAQRSVADAVGKFPAHGLRVNITSHSDDKC